MSLTQIVFIILAGLALLGAVGMVALRNLVHTVLSMVLSFLAVAGIFILLEAGFLAAVQILIYVGALAILITMAIMLTRDLRDRKAHVNAAQWPLALVVAAAFFAVLGVLVLRANWPTVTASVTGDEVVALGQALVGPYALPFEVASVLLLVAAVGAIVIVREART